MIKILKPIKDTYVNNRIINNIDLSDSNTGKAATIDLFKLYSPSSSIAPEKIELSRGLIKFDLSDIKNKVNLGIIDINDNSFKCLIKLFNVNSGQTLPANFSLRILPLSRSFDEGLGRDVVGYNDIDVANFLTASTNPTIITWLSGGAGCSGSISENVDIIEDFKKTQFFTIGNENLNLDITDIISSSITNQIPDHGFLIAFDNNHETDDKTYFVKRFASKEAYDKSKHPTLTIQYDDSIVDTLKNISFNEIGTTYLHNISPGTFDTKNIRSGSLELTGVDCLKFVLTTDHPVISSSFFFSGSQYLNKTGIYSASFVVNDENVLNIIEQTGSVSFLPKWVSNDQNITFKILDKITIKKNNDFFDGIDQFKIGINNQTLYNETENIVFYLTAFKNSSFLKSFKIPIENTGEIISGLKYSVRDIQDNSVIIDFSDGTKLSNDLNKHHFQVDMSNLVIGRTYTIDILYEDSKTRKIYQNISNPFTVVKNK